MSGWLSGDEREVGSLPVVCLMEGKRERVREGGGGEVERVREGGR